MSNIRYQTFNLNIPNGTLAGATGQSLFTLDNDYNSCTGIAVLALGSLGNNLIGIGIENQSRVILDTVLNDLWRPSTDTPADGRFTPVKFSASGRQLKINWENFGANTVNDTRFQIVFRLEN